MKWKLKFETTAGISFLFWKMVDDCNFGLFLKKTHFILAYCILNNRKQSVFVLFFRFSSSVGGTATTLPPPFWYLTIRVFFPQSLLQGQVREVFSPYRLFIFGLKFSAIFSSMSPPSRRLQTKPVITCLKTFLISYSLIFWVSSADTKWGKQAKGATMG